MIKQTIIIRDETLRKRVIGLLNNIDLTHPWEVTIKPYRKRRSLSQNALYWKWLEEVVAEVSNYTGHAKDEIHAFFKEKFCPAQTIEINGEIVVHRTTTRLTPAEMKEYMDQVYAFATTELGLVLPLPEEAYLQKEDVA